MKKQEIYLGPGSLRRLESLLDETTRGQVLAIIDHNAYRHSGAEGQIDELLNSYGSLFFSDFAPNPKIEDVLTGAQLFRQCKPRVVLSVGGGTAIDMAKLISSLALSDHPLESVMGQRPVTANPTRLIAIPTTAGTGSESTQFAVVYINGQKYSLDHPSLLPDVAIVDPELTQNLPPSITAATGLDALCQAMESLWAVSADSTSIGFASEALTLATQHIAPATNSPTTADREAMCRAANLAGQAINITRTTACHALSYAMTSYHGIPHGIAVALTLAPMLRFNSLVCDADCADARGAVAVRERIRLILHCIKADSIQAAVQKIEQLLRQVGCPITPAEAGIRSANDIERIVQSVNVQRMSNNPRQATAEMLRLMLTGQS